MKFVLYCAVLINFFNFGSLYSEPKPQEQAIVAQAAMLKANWVEDDGVWPGFDLKTKPAVFVFPSGGIFALSFHSSEPNWESLKVDSYEMQFSKEDRWELQGSPMDPHAHIDGQQVFVFPMTGPVTDGEKQIRVWVHENYHLYQFQHFSPVRLRPPQHQDYLQPDQLTLVELENALLYDFVNGDHSVDLLKDFLAINKVRQEKLHPSSHSWESGQQKIEG